MLHGLTAIGHCSARRPQGKLVTSLKDASIHVIVYSGFIYEDIVRAKEPAIDKVLALGDVLVDGPFVAALRDESLACRGSSNQPVIDLVKTRQTGSLSLLQWD